MKIIAALGNPGEKYKYTRHNAGFLVADFLVQKYNLDLKFESKFNALFAKNSDIMLVLPQTFMNLSGEAISAVINFYKLSASDLFVIYDDIALDLGRIRFRENGSDGGHNGVKSIISHIGSNEFDRLKFGIGPQLYTSESYVLQNFPRESLECLKKALIGSSDAIDFYLKQGIKEAQNKYNGIHFC